MNKYISNLEAGSKISSTLSGLSSMKKLHTDLITQTYTDLLGIDIDESEQYILLASLNQWQIFKHSEGSLQFINSAAYTSLNSAKWLPIDASIFFSSSKDAVCLWDSNSGVCVSETPVQRCRTLQPHLTSVEIVIVSCLNNTMLKDYRDWSNVATINEDSVCAKWSPYSDNFFVTSNPGFIKIWDIRRPKSSIFQLGFLDSTLPCKKQKGINQENIYDNFFLEKNSKKVLFDSVLDVDFTKDGRFLLARCTQNIIKFDLLNAENPPETIINYQAKSKSSFIKFFNQELVIGDSKCIFRYDLNYNLLQSINCNHKCLYIVEIAQEDTCYAITNKGHLIRYVPVYGE